MTSNLRIDESLDERTDEATGFQHDFGSDNETSARDYDATSFPSGPRPCSLSTRRFPCRSGSVSGEGNSEEYGDSYDARSGERSDASPERRRCDQSGRLAEAAGDVVFGVSLFGGGEDLFGRAELSEHAEEHEAGVVGDPGRLLHVVGDDDDAVLFGQAAH